MRRSDRDRKNAIGDEYDVNTLNAADHKQAMIMPLIGKVGRTRDEVAAHAKEIGIHVNTLYRWIAKYELEPGILSLVREKRKDDGFRRLPPEVEEIINRAVCEGSGDPTPLKTIAIKVALECRAKGLPAPHYNTVRTRASEIRRKQSQRVSADENIAGEQYLEELSARSPFEAVLIDSLHLKLLVAQSGLPHTRPWVTIAFDCFSRAIVGYSAGTGPAAIIATEKCLVSAILPKEKLLEELAVSGAWPCFGIPRSLLVPNAVGIRTAPLERGCAEYKINLREVIELDFGSYIQKYLNAFSNEIRSLEFDIAKRGRQLSMRKLQQHLVRAIVSHNSAICRETGRTPIALFESSMPETRALQDRLRDPEVQDRIRIDFMPSLERKVSKKGVMIDGVHYHHPFLDAYASAAAKESGGEQSATVMLRRDPDDVRRVWVGDPEQGEYALLTCRLNLKEKMTVRQLKEFKRQFEGRVRDLMKLRNGKEVFEVLKVLDKRRARLGAKDPKGSGS